MGSEMKSRLHRIPVMEQPFAPTPVVRLGGPWSDNEIWMKRDDLLPFSFGGNKARKAWQFYHEILQEEPDIVMTYGSNASNHCRIIANMARAMGLPCHIIANDHTVEGKDGRELFNRILVEEFGASVETVPTDQVHDTIEARMEEYRSRGLRPYFIQGGGHGNTGTAAYAEVWREIRSQERALGTAFSHIVLASGTGATQGGLVAGRVMERVQRAGGLMESVRQTGEDEAAVPQTQRRNPEAALPEVVGISIARRNPRGGDVVRESVLDYLSMLDENPIPEEGSLGDSAGRFGQERSTQEQTGYRRFYTEEDLVFDDHYILGGYGAYNEEVTQVISKMMEQEGIPMDTTYTGKAFTGMLHYLEDHGIHGQQVLFIHTGGTPLFFDRL